MLFLVNIVNQSTHFGIGRMPRGFKGHPLCRYVSEKRDFRFSETYPSCLYSKIVITSTVVVKLCRVKIFRTWCGKPVRLRSGQ